MQHVRRRGWSWFAAGILAGLCASTMPSATAAASAPEIAGLRQLFDGAMPPDLEVATFSHSDRLLPVRWVRHGAAASALPKRGQAFPAIHFEDHGRRFDLYDYLSSNRVAGLLILKDGEVALEDYELGCGPDTHWISFSMAKSVASTLVGAALVDGLIASLDDPVVRYVPALRGGAYDGVSVRQILTMSSGVGWDETYTDPRSDRRKILELQIAAKPGEALHYMSARSRVAAPGAVWNYNTGETYVLGAVIEGATHRPLASYLSEKIWVPAGMESDASWWLDSPDGIAWAGSGLGATLRDFGRFGLLAANGGRIRGKSVVPDGWFTSAGAAQVIGGKPVDYGYMWWIPPQSEPMHAGAFEAEGIFGQYLYVNPRERLVIVVLSARSKPSETSRLELDDEAFFAAVAKALH
jgi:CubicO group peptidase (beta-lactamase class C family)